MKIAGCIFQQRKITEYSKKHFEAEYKGHSIYVTRDHGFGKSKEYGKKRFYINVEDLNADSFTTCCDTYDDFENIEKAIEYALHGAMLLPDQRN
ncbi:hypothetical protein J0X14_14335 [Muricauda sp. CAU 1633]|uniref:hypothetical protein n=1 Tax=Allomuricauda sp. CAU 1633 TaxID=2816036 RepID=UPI001A8C69E1|nr:hypothetical protein [Muricauda sp. CAU 1633]MBO0323483.1 hypothetical protein [Muricauda sp. CAU 1633]